MSSYYHNYFGIRKYGSSFYFTLITPDVWYSLMKWIELFLEYWYWFPLEDVYRYSLFKTFHLLLIPCRIMMPDFNSIFGFNGVEMISGYSFFRVLINLIGSFVPLVSNCFDWPFRCVPVYDWILHLFILLFLTP